MISEINSYTIYNTRKDKKFENGYYFYKRIMY